MYCMQDPWPIKESPYCAKDEDVEEERGWGELQTAKEAEGFPLCLWGKRQKNPFAHSKLKGRDKTPAYLLFDIPLLSSACCFFARHQSVSAPLSLLFVFARGLFKISLISTISAYSVDLSLFLPLLPTPPVTRKKTGARLKMFGEAIDLRGGDCAAGARGGRVISLESPQSPLNPNLHTLWCHLYF